MITLFIVDNIISLWNV